MRKRFLTLMIATSLLLVSHQSHAFGKIVSDPGAYARMAQELAETKKIFDEMVKQVEQMKQGVNAMTGKGFLGQQMLGDLQQLRNMAEQATPSILKNAFDNASNLDFRSPSDIAKILNQIYVPPIDDPFAHIKNSLKRRDYQQKTLKSALENAESLINETDDIFARLGTLTHQIDETSDIKQAMDLNNKLLTQLLLGQQKLILLTANITRAEAAAKYTGVKSDEAASKEQQPYWERELEKEKSGAQSNGSMIDVPCPPMLERRGKCVYTRTRSR